jgi:AraC family transcriptional regulator
MSSTVLFERNADAFVLRLVRYAPGRQMPLHAHDEHGISIVLDGALVEEAEHRSVTATAGWTVVKPAGTYHANRFGPAPTTLLGLVFREPHDDREQRAWRWLDRATTYRAGLRLLRAVMRGATADRSEAAADLMASLGAATVSRREIPWLLDVKSALDEPFAAESVDDLAARAGVHPIYLARRFRGAFGMSMREYRQIAQVRRATQLIVGTRRPLSEIAHSCGYADHSHMCRSFRRVARMNPAALRASRQVRIVQAIDRALRQP